MTYMRSAIVLAICVCCLIPTAQAATFNFDTLSLLRITPISTSNAGVTATFGTPGFSIQDNSTAASPVPPPFDLRFLYPDSLSSSLLDIGFDAMLTSISLDFALTTNGPYLDQFSPLRMTAGSASVESRGTPNGAYNIGSLLILSAAPFNSVHIDFNGAQATTFLIDNVAVVTAAVDTVPEPGTFLLMGAAFTAIALVRRRSRLRV